MYNERTLNIIQKVKLEESMFSTEIFDVLFTWHAELSLDSIVVYFTIPHSRKKYNKSVTEISEKKMEKFFSELYDFVRSADRCCDVADDVARKTTFVYEEGAHSELFAGEIFKGNKEMAPMIIDFIKKQGVKNYWEMEGYEYLFKDRLGC